MGPRQGHRKIQEVSLQSAPTFPTFPRKQFLTHSIVLSFTLRMTVAVQGLVMYLISMRMSSLFLFVYKVHVHMHFYLYKDAQLGTKTLYIYIFFLCFVYITAVDSNSQTLQPITLELRRRKISKRSDTPLKRPRLDKNSCESPVYVYVAFVSVCPFFLRALMTVFEYVS